MQSWSDEIVWQGSDSTKLPGGGEHRGKEAVLQVLQQAIGAWDEFELTADEFYERGDTVVVLGHADVRKGNETAQIPVVHIWRYADDRIKCVQVLSDTFQTAELLGIV